MHPLIVVERSWELVDGLPAEAYDLEWWFASAVLDGVTVGSVSFMVVTSDHPWAEDLCPALHSEGPADCGIEVHAATVDPDHRGHDLGLRLVAAGLARLTQGRASYVWGTLEPVGWQSFTQDRRAPAIVALHRYWRRLGFPPREVRPDFGEIRESALVRDYEIPARIAR